MELRFTERTPRSLAIIVTCQPISTSSPPEEDKQDYISLLSSSEVILIRDEADPTVDVTTSGV